MVLYRLLKVLADAHNHGVVHQDIKPEDTLFTEDGGLKVVDWGLAK